MPIDKFIALALMILTGICVTHPMDAALTIRKVELSILREASDTRSWGLPVVFPEHLSISPLRSRHVRRSGGAGNSPMPGRRS